MTGRSRYEQLDSTLSNRDYNTNGVLVGSKRQR